MRNGVKVGQRQLSKPQHIQTRTWNTIGIAFSKVKSDQSTNLGGVGK